MICQVAAEGRDRRIPVYHAAEHDLNSIALLHKRRHRFAHRRHSALIESGELPRTEGASASARQYARAVLTLPCSARSASSGGSGSLAVCLSIRSVVLKSGVSSSGPSVLVRYTRQHENFVLIAPCRSPRRFYSSFWLLTSGFHIPQGYQGRSPYSPKVFLVDRR